MIIAVSPGDTRASSASRRPGSEARSRSPSFSKSSWKTTRGSRKPHNPFASQTTIRSTFVCGRMGSTFSSCSSFSTKMTRASECSRR